MLIAFVRRRKDVPFPFVFWLFGAFILGCGMTHFMDVVTTYWPVHWLAGLVKAFTAGVSLATAVALVPVMPRALALRGPSEMEQEIRRRKGAEARLLETQANLEHLIRERTTALQDSEERHRLLVEFSPDAILMLDDGIVTFANPAAAWLLGRATPRELIGRSHLSYVHPFFRADVRRCLLEVASTGSLSPWSEQLWLRANGSTVSVETSCFRFPGRERPLVNVIARDVGERHRQEARFRLAVEVAPNGMLLVGRDGKIALANTQVEKLFGYAAGELLGLSVEQLVPGPFRAGHPAHRAGFFADPSPRGMGEGRELFGLRKDGSEVPVEIGLQPIPMDDDLFVLASIIDVSERRRAEETVRRSELVLRDLFENATVGLHWVGPDGVVLRANQAELDLLGYTSDEYVGHPLAEFHADRMVIEEVLTRLRRGEELQNVEARLRCKNGSVKHVLLSANVFWEGGRFIHARCFTRDVTAQKEAEAALRLAHAGLESKVQERTAELALANSRLAKSLSEKEVLLREIHHRVKNNLQVISSLLDLQAHHVCDELGKEMFRESRQRVRAMALVHERLYRSTDLAQVDFTAYVEGLVTSLFTSYRVDAERIHAVVTVRDVSLPVDAAMPCGLLLNELVANCLKHAFPGRDQGTIRVELAPVDAAHYLLSVADDGIGIAEGVGPQNAATFGLQLVSDLVHQLHGMVEIDRAAGTTFRVRFPMTKGPLLERNG